MKHAKTWLMLGGFFLAVDFAIAWNAWDAGFWATYLLAFLFWLQFPLGFLALFLIHNLSGGRWGDSVSAPLRAGSQGLRFFGFLFLPIFVGARRLYPWIREPGILGGEQDRYLNFPFFTLRTFFYLLSWAALGWLAARNWKRSRDRPVGIVRLQYLSAWGLVLLALTVSFASFDWSMSLDPLWHSTVYGLLWITGQGVAALAALILYQSLVSGSADARQDLASLLLAYLMTWAYLAFMQYLIIWSGNLPTEASWYLERRAGVWKTFPALLTVGGFILPFFSLLSRRLKRHATFMIFVALWILVSRALDLCWLVLPSVHVEMPKNFWNSIFACAGLGCFSYWIFRYELARCV